MENLNIMEYALSLGSNLGNRLTNLSKAKKLLSHKLNAEVLDQSSVYETAPVGVQPQYEELQYLNTVLILQTDASPENVLQTIHSIEADMGRIRTADRCAPRPIDIDILYAGNTISDCEDLELPHPRWSERRFVVQPLAEARPNLILPNTHQTVAETLKNLPDIPKVTHFTTEW